MHTHSNWDWKYCLKKKIFRFIYKKVFYSWWHLLHPRFHLLLSIQFWTENSRLALPHKPHACTTLLSCLSLFFALLWSGIQCHTQLGHLSTHIQHKWPYQHSHLAFIASMTSKTTPFSSLMYVFHNLSCLFFAEPYPKINFCFYYFRHIIFITIP